MLQQKQIMLSTRHPEQCYVLVTPYSFVQTNSRLPSSRVLKRFFSVFVASDLCLILVAYRITDLPAGVFLINSNPTI